VVPNTEVAGATITVNGQHFAGTSKVTFGGVSATFVYNSPTSLLSGVLDGAAGSINGTTKADRAPNEIGLGSGVFSIGAPRSIEFGIKVNF